MIYKGFRIVECDDGTYDIVDGDGLVASEFKSIEDAQDKIDKDLD